MTYDGRVSTTSLTPRRIYRIVAIAEMVTWALLILGMVGKYILKLGDWPVRVFGLTHGIVFVTYAFVALLVGVNQHWRLRHVIAAVATAVIPFATYPFDVWLERRGMLTGGWRTERSEDPRDHTRLSGVLRFALRYPIPLAVVVIIGVFAVVSFLLWLGPPTEWGA